MVKITKGTTHKPMASQQLVDFFAHHGEFDGYLYIGYPIIATATGPYSIDAIYVSEEHGLVIFNLIESYGIEGYQNAQDDSYNKMHAKLRNHSELVNKRRLCVEINVVTFAPILKDFTFTDDYPICNEHTLANYLSNIAWDDSNYFPVLLSVLQAVSTIRRSKRKRDTYKPDSKGAKLKYIENSIANLDERQGKAVLETVEGVQRIRGLAGSGKTIVLALKAAYLHAQHPEWKIAVTFHTRSLKGQFHQLINMFSIEQAGEEPNWENLQIIHSWGAPGGESKNGIYYTFCKLHELQYYDFTNAKAAYPDEPFERICDKAVSEVPDAKPIYDAILVDEAQDFSPSFLKMCYELLREPKRLVYAYDELQNLGSQSLPAPEEIFGLSNSGNYNVSFSEDDKQQDIILEKCYRNSRPALVTAHALGFGLYRTNQTKQSRIVQMFENNNLWQDIGYYVKEGSLEDGQHVVLARNENTSPKFLEDHSLIDDLITFKAFDSIEEQNTWVAEQIENDLDDELRLDDIIVINPDPLTTRKQVAPIRAKLFEKGIQNHIAGVDTSPDIFFTNESIVFTGIYRAKGNEAAMVYVINAQDCYASLTEIATVRNRLFTAITRSKAWVRVLGVGSQMEKLVQEFQQVKDHNFELDFIYPTKSERERMNIVNRDMSMAQKNALSKSRKSLDTLLSALDKGEILPEDFPEEQLERLKEFLGDREND